MSNFTYSAMSGKNDPMFGKFEHPIKALIENESNICEKKKTILRHTKPQKTSRQV